MARLNVQNIQGEANGQRAFALALNAIIADLMPRIKTKAKNLDEARFMKEYQELLARKANADYAADLLDERSRTAELSLEMTQTLQKTLRRRYEEPGHALNYKDRINSAKAAFLQNFREAYVRLLAASEGLSVIFPHAPGGDVTELDIPAFPNLLTSGYSEIGYVDRLMAYGRQVLFAIDRIDSFSHEYRLLLSVKVLMDRGKGQFQPPAGKYGLSLTKTDIGELNYPRIQHLDIHIVPRTMTAADDAAFRAKHASFAGRVRLPQQGSVGSEVLQLPTFRFGDAEEYQGGSTRPLRSAGYLNANPIGAWEIEMPPLSHAKTAVSVPNDVWVELVVVGMRRPGQN